MRTEKLLDAAIEAQRRGKLEGALELYRRVLAREPAHALALGLAGSAEAERGNGVEALALLRRAAELRPDDPRILVSLGSVLHEQGRAAEAAQTAERAVRLAPSLAQSWTLLAQIVLRHPPGGEALAALKRLSPLYPAGPEDIYLSLGAALQKAGRVADAIEVLRESLRVRPGSIETYRRLGRLCANRGEWESAAACSLQITRLHPDDASAWLELAVARREQERREEAAMAFETAHRLRPDDPGILSDLGALFLRCGRVRDAEHVVNRALALRPDHAPALCNRANVLRALGRFAEAEAALRAALSIDPRMAAAWYTLTDMVRTAPGDPTCHTVEALLADPGTPRGDRVALGFALAKMRADVGDDENAFRAYEAANAVAAEALEGAGRGYDPRARDSEVERLVASYDRRALDGLARARNRDARPVFIIGMPRSGTTLVEQILAAHSRIGAAGERADIAALAVELGDGGGRASTAELDSLASSHLERLAREFPQAARITDKMPANFQHLGLISRLLPAARAIHVVRDPLDTCVSLFTHNLDAAHAYSRRLEHLGHYYRAYRRLMDHWNAVRPLPILDVRYEELVEDIEGVARRIVEFCGLEWEECCLRFDVVERPVLTASQIQVRQPLTRVSIGRWRRYERFLAPLRAALEEPRT